MSVLIVGAGGHAQVIADILLLLQKQDKLYQPVGYLDDDPALAKQKFLGLAVLGTLNSIDGISHDAIIIAIGDNRQRLRLFTKFSELGERFVTVCHPQTILAASADIDLGTMVCAGAVVNPGCIIGANAILNTSCSVDHHCCIGDHVHIAPGAHLGGNVSIGTGALVGIGATVMPGRQIGAWSIVGAGALVTDDVPDGQIVVGVPAKPFEKR